jgi:hypothetical protein
VLRWDGGSGNEQQEPTLLVIYMYIYIPVRRYVFQAHSSRYPYHIGLFLACLLTSGALRGRLFTPSARKQNAPPPPRQTPHLPSLPSPVLPPTPYAPPGARGAGGAAAAVARQSEFRPFALLPLACCSLQLAGWCLKRTIARAGLFPHLFVNET